MITSTYPKDGLPKALSTRGLEFIRKRFQEEWGVYRNDVTLELINGRKNLILTHRGNLVGWLGSETDGELTNGCIQKGFNGTDWLAKLIQRTSQDNKDHFAYIPLQDFASGIACYRACDGHVNIHNEFSTKNYKESSITLVKVSLWSKETIEFNELISILEERRKQQCPA